MLKGKIDENKLNAFLGKNTKFQGTLLFDGLVKIDGEFDGNVKTKDTLIIAESSKVKGEIEAGIVRISGSFEGNIFAKSRVELYKPATVTGKINVPVFSIEEGVIFNGTSDMSNETSKIKTTLKEVRHD